MPQKNGLFQIDRLQKVHPGKQTAYLSAPTSA